MWCSIASVSRIGIPLCHTCRHQVQNNRQYLANHLRACLQLGDRRVFLSWKSSLALSCLGHRTRKDMVDNYRTQIFSTDALSTKDSSNQLKRILLNQSKISRHSIYRTFKTQSSELHKLRILQTDGQKKSERIRPYGPHTNNIEERDSRFDLLKSASLSLGPKCCSRTNSDRGVKHSNVMQICVCSVNGTLLYRKMKNKCYHVRTCAFHTTAERKSVQDGVTVRQEPPWRILFFGTDDIALHTLKSLYRNMTSDGSLVESIEVVTVKEQRAVRSFAESVQLKIHKWPVATETEKYDVGVLVSFGHLIPDAVIHMFPYGILNMHPSLLPRWRGASPIIHTILNGDDVTGVSVMEIRPKHFDIGPLLLQRKCVVPHRCTSFQLADILGPFGASMMLECLKDLPTLERFEHEQDSRGITYAHKLKHNNCNIDWENSTSEEIDCQYRAISELMTLKTELNDHTVKLLDLVEPDLLKDIDNKDIRGFKGDMIHARPGTVAYHKLLKCIVIRCKQGVVGFRSIVLRKKLTALDFFNGYINKNRCTRFTSLENDLNKFVRMERIPMQSKG